MNLHRCYLSILSLLVLISCLSLSGCKKKSRPVTTTIHGHITTQDPSVVASNVVIQIFYTKNTLGLVKYSVLKDSVLSDHNGDYHLSFTNQRITENDILGSEYYTFKLKKDPLIKNLSSDGQPYQLGKDNEIGLSVIIYQPFKAKFTLKSPPNGLIQVDTQQGYFGLYLSKPDTLANIIVPKAQKTILSYTIVSSVQASLTLKQRDTIDLIATPNLQAKSFFIDN